MIKIDFKKELEIASRGMIMIHDPKLLIKLIVRMLVSKLGLKHGAMILYDDIKKAYVLSISRGDKGVKIPTGFTKFTKNSPIIKLFNKSEYRTLIGDRNAILAQDINKLVWQESVVENGNGNGTKELLHQVEDQMQMFNASACVPAYYRRDLMAVLLLGEKKDGKAFEQEELDFFAALASDTAMAIRNAQLFLRMKGEAERSKKLFIQTIAVLGSTIEAKDAYTRGHVDRVTKYSLAIARRMVDNGTASFPKKYFENLYIAGLLHDIGKIGVPEVILNKKGSLTDEEFRLMKEHPVRGAEIVKALGLPQECIDGILYHHEAFSGKGYPSGLTADKIPITAAIIAVADTLDAMTSDRPYRKSLSKEVAFQEIKKCAGTQFYPEVATAALELYEAGEM